MDSMRGENYTIHKAKDIGEMNAFVFDQAQEFAEVYGKHFKGLFYGRIPSTGEKSWFIRFSPSSKNCFVVNRQFVVDWIEDFLADCKKQVLIESGPVPFPFPTILDFPLFAPAMCEALQGHKTVSKDRMRRDDLRFQLPSFTGRNGMTIFEMDELPSGSWPSESRGKGSITGAKATKRSSASRAAQLAKETPREAGVYVYSYGSYVDHAGPDGSHLVKVGCAKNIAQRVGSQASRTEVPEDLILLRAYLTPDQLTVEGEFHTHLKAMGRHHRTVSGGIEWFVASLAELDAFATQLGLEVIKLPTTP